MIYTLEDKIKLLGLTNSRLEELNNIKVKYIDNGSIKINKRSACVIDIDDLVGTTRSLDANTWIDILNENFHKPITLEKFIDTDSFKYFIERANMKEDYPVVYKKDNKYYIAKEGLHRLTVAKCIGIKKAYCIVDEE